MVQPVANRHPFLRAGQMGVAVGAVALVVYAMTVGRMAFPGFPATVLWSYLGEDLPLPVLYPLWGWLVRALDKLPGVPVALAINLISALCGVGCVSLLAGLMFRVRYHGLLVDAALMQFVREDQARRLSSWVAGLYLAVCIPFWVASTRSLPDTFHLLLLLLAASLFSQYQQQGRLRYLAALSVLYGVGLVESASFLLFLPVFVVRVLGEMYRFRVIQSWRIQGLVWGGVGLGLMVLPLHIVTWLRRAAALGVVDNWRAVTVSFGSDYLAALLQFRQHSGFIVLMLMAFVPWAMVFLLSRRSPWNYDPDQVPVRFVFVIGLLAILYDAPFSFWNLLGVEGLMLPAHALLAASMGYMSGELWIVGSRRSVSNTSRIQQGIHWTAAIMVPLIPLFIFGAGFHNRTVVNTRQVEIINRSVRNIVRRLHGRDIVFANQWLGDLIKLEARVHQVPLLLVDINQLKSPVYMRRLARQLPPGIPREGLMDGDIDRFLDEMLLSDEGLSRLAFLDMADVLRGYGYLVPDGLLYRLVASRDEVDWSALVESQHSFWKLWSAPCVISQDNPARLYADQLRSQVGKAANDLGVILAQLEQKSKAVDIFRDVLEIDPDNLSARMNLIDLLRDQNPLQVDNMIADWARIAKQQERNRWALSVRYGYLLDASGWAQRDATWALSGQPLMAEAYRRHPDFYNPAALAREQFLDQVYLQWGQRPTSEFTVRMSLIRDERDSRVFQNLVRLAIRRNDPAAAEAYLLEALKLGMTSRQAAFDYAMITYLREGVTAAGKRLADITQVDPANERAWLARFLWAEPGSKQAQQCLRSLHEIDSTDVGLHLTVAWWHMCQSEWEQARAECEIAVRLDPQNISAWELLLAWAQAQQDRPLAGACRQALRERQRDHPLQWIETAAKFARKKDLKSAESVLRKGLYQSRHPDVLYALANTIMDQDSDLTEAQALLGEALLRRPFQTTYQLARRECLRRQGVIPTAEADRLALFARYSDNAPLRWLDLYCWATQDDAWQLSYFDVRQVIRRHRDLQPSEQIE